MRRDNAPRRDPGRRGPPPEGIPLKGRRERVPKAPRSRPEPRVEEPRDPVIAHLSSRYEEAYFLQRAAENTWINSSQFGEPLFGVSGFIVADPTEPLPVGYARVSTIASRGFRVIPTPHLGRRGHVTILLDDPVDDDQAARFNEAFGRGVDE